MSQDWVRILGKDRDGKHIGVDRNFQYLGREQKQLH